MARTRYSETELREAVAAATTIAGVLRSLGLAPAGGNYRTLKMRLADLAIDTSHFKGQAWSRGLKRPAPRRPLSDLLVEGRATNSHRLKDRLIREGVFDARCARCQRVEWEGSAIPLELDHINGVSDDNRLINLCLLCPNCHALTPTYRGRNIGQKSPPCPNWQRRAA